MTRHVTLIGFGAIAQEVCRSLESDDQIRIHQVLVRPQRKIVVQDLLPTGTRAIDSLNDLDPKTDFVLECAGHDAVRYFAAPVLNKGIDFGLVSAGALAEDAVLETLQDARRSGGARLVIVPGAIGGIDALAAARAGLDKVTYVGRKPPVSWQGSPAEETYDLAALATATDIFEGTAREAAQRFPKNANVVATVALAGVGFDQTQVTLVADPHATGNTHHISAVGPLFDLQYSTTGAALPSNPKTSALTAHSAIRTLQQLGSGLHI